MKVKISKVTKTFFKCGNCGAENEVFNTIVKPDSCLACGVNGPNFKMVGRIELKNTSEITELPLPPET